MNNPIAGRNILFLYFLGFALVLCAIFYIKCVLFLEYPVPWNDETAFIAQALELSKTGSLFVYGLHPERDIMWMPPGFMVVLAGAYKVFGYSFELSRWVSALCFLGSYCTCLLIVHKNLTGATRIFGFIFMTAVFLSPINLLTSNIARMESMYVLILLISLLAALLEKYLLSLSLVCVAALVHFNAVYFLIPVCYAIALQLITTRTLTISKNEILFLLLSCLMGFSYFYYVYLNWPGFVEDMRFQFAFKRVFGPTMGGAKNSVFCGLILVVVTLWSLRCKAITAESIFALFGLSFLMLGFNGRGAMWYEFSFMLAILFFGLCFLCIYQKHQSQQMVAMIACTAFALSMLMVIKGNYRWAEKAPFEMLNKDSRYYGDERKFLSEGEIDKVSSFIAELDPGTKVTFGYSGVAPLFFSAFEKSGAIWTAHVYSMSKPFPVREVDYRIVCDSPLFPRGLFKLDFPAFKRDGKNTGCIIKPDSADED